MAQKVVAYARGLEDGGVLSVCKHFPGHGDTEVDSHKALPVLNFDRARLDSIELFPFKEAVKAGLGGMMVGHLEVPELGKIRLRFLHILFIICFVGNWAFKAWFLQMLWR